MKKTTALAGGLSGAAALTLIHETVRRFDPQAPRMDLLGMQSLAKIIRAFGKQPPAKGKLYALTLMGDVAGNALYYSLAALGRRQGVFVRGILLGLGAGIGAVLLPKPLGLNEAYSNRTTETKMLTLGLYLIGGLVASATMRLAEKRKGRKRLKGENFIY